jgi:hypothetical protein
VGGAHRLWQRDRDARFLARQDFLAVEVAAVGDDIEALRFQRCFGLLGHVRELRPVGPDVGYLMCDDQMMFGVDGDLNVIANDAGASTARRHRAGVGIGLLRASLCREIDALEKRLGGK